MTAYARHWIGIFAIIFSAAWYVPATGQSPEPAAIAIVGAMVVDGTGAPPAAATVLIRGEHIAALGEKLDVPRGARVIHAEGQTLLPGLFDLHTHLPYSTTNVSGDWPTQVEAYLYCGVTSVVDVGTYFETFEPMRRLIASGAVQAPRISLAARIALPGGHGAEGGRGDYFSLEVQTSRQARAAIRRLVAYKPDIIKVFNDGWRYGASPDLTSMNEATLTALVDEAHKNSLRVITHTVSLQGDKIAARAGVDIIGHGVGDADVDPEVIQLLRTKGSTYVSTLAVYENRGRDFNSPLFATILEPAVKSALAEERRPRPDRPRTEPAGQRETPNPRDLRWTHLLHNAAALNAAGVAVGVGTDAGEGGTFHGWATLRELELLVGAGITPLDAIKAATLTSAHGLGVDNKRGTIAPGKLADLVLVEGAPYRNISDIERVRRVFLGGREVDRERLARDIASPDPTPLQATRPAELIDDFETDSPDPYLLRSKLGTLWVNSTDAGSDHSNMIFGRTLRAPGDHALSVMGRMSVGERAFVAVSVPLNRGGIEPADTTQFRGIRFDVRGDGEYRLLVPTRAIRNGNFYQANFTAAATWQTVSIDFAALKQRDQAQPVPWTGTDVLSLSFIIPRPAGSVGWLELDNVRFYK